MHYRIETIEIRSRQIAEVFADLRYFLGRLPELATRKQVCVQADNLMAGGPQNRPRNGTDIASVASQ